MPPFLPRKRLRSSSPEPDSQPGPSKQQNKGKKSKSSKATPRKATLFDDLDAGAKSPEDTKAILRKIQATDEDDESSLSSLSDDEFEDVPNTNRQPNDDATEDEDEDEDEDIEFEDVDTNITDKPSANIPTGDLELTLTKETRISLTNPLGTKKGPSKIERGIRMATHQVHVQMLMWHNAIRNSWLCDKELQDILVGKLPETILREIEKWRKDSGLQSKVDDTPKSKGKGKGKVTKGKKVDIRSQRDWGQPAERQEAGEINMSRGDPMFRLLKLLIHYWKQRFRIVAPGLRKIGYMSLERLDQESKSFQKDEHDFERHGERIINIHEFRKCAKSLEGSRDVGAQLFTALLRGIGIESRMIASLQPVGFGWNKNEDAIEKKDKKRNEPIPEDDTSDTESSEEEKHVSKPNSKSTTTPTTKPTAKPPPKSSKKLNGTGKSTLVPNNPSKSTNNSARRSSRGNGLKDAPIDLSDSEEVSMVNNEEDDDESVVDTTPAKTRIQPSKPYDKDLLFPHYWTEVLSPITNTYTPIDPLVLSVIATNPELLQKFEPRGAKADKAKQVTAYIIGHSSDGTAKDVTVRYLKGHTLPGRTKGNRIPIEKIPVYNSQGKIKRYDQYDWFKTVMSGYVRGSNFKRPRTEIDDHEEATDLKAIQPKKKEVKEGEETLQSYKSSTEFVLERHLRREEAILDTAKHVKMFTVKAKGDNPTEEKVFLRKDVVSCKSLETWHKEGRAPLPGAIPRKRVPYRAATTNRKRELAEAELESGEKMLQGLYSRDQTDWIIPPPIENGVIPKNNYGNMDVYVPSMVPVGAVHIPRRGTKRICTRLGIDYAEAVTGFEFGARMAIPIITGVVVAEENFDLVMEEWEKDEAERVRKEDEKKTKAAIGMWRKMLMGLRIIERMTDEYGHGGEEVDAVNPFNNKNKKGKEVDGDPELEEKALEMQQQDEEMAGGFFPEGYNEEEPEEHHSTSFFPVVASQDDGDGGGFIVEDEGKEITNRINGANGTPYATSQTFQFIGNENTEPNPTSGDDVESEEEIQHKKPQVVIPAPTSRSRGRSAASTNKPPAKAKPTPTSKPKPKTPAKRAAPISKTPGKRKRIPDLEDDEDIEDNESSSLSDIEVDDDAEEEDEVIKPSPKKSVPRKSVTKRKETISVTSSPATRKTPSRNAKRVSETGTRSRYFEHEDSGEE
ncbi:putative rad4 family protein [Botrytis fragariae]|uniref:Putative rad4 family protein n=1 Tax=Botrytis fragariae TaxID=1964551 RepID=A0A8H6ASP7_9HELO|nr:putative rad4 family protein [Botrytis fragariae]KAF5872725.1 putative rad4 family protein [Botrytis fragariae]